MATDWTSPKTSDTHTNELAATRGRDESNARMDYTGDTNIPDGTIRWNKANNRFEIWSTASSTWSVLSSKYLINVDTVDGYHAGNASGNVPVSNGTVNTNLNADKLDGQHGTFFQARENHTGTQAPSTISPQGTGSGLDADKLDGQHASSFLQASSYTASDVLTKIKTVDGSGSGLDADLLDGLDSSRYHKAAVSAFTGGDWNSLTQHGTYKIQHETFDNDTNHPPAISPYGILNVFVSEIGGENRICQIYIPHQSHDKYIYERMFNAGGWTEWRKIWKGGTGSGSGLDADLLDGKHLSEIGGSAWDVIIEDRKPKGTHGGKFESGAWRTRDLNTLVFNHNSLASLSNNRFTLPAGTYCIDWDAPAHNVNNHKSALYNYTGSTIVAYGTSARSDIISSTATSSTTSSVGTTVITVTSSTTFEIRHICGTTRDSVGFGIATNLATEIYTRVRIKKIA